DTVVELAGSFFLDCQTVAEARSALGQGQSSNTGEVSLQDILPSGLHTQVEADRRIASDENSRVSAADPAAVPEEQMEVVISNPQITKPTASSPRKPAAAGT